MTHSDPVAAVAARRRFTDLLALLPENVRPRTKDQRRRFLKRLKMLGVEVTYLGRHAMLDPDALEAALPRLFREDANTPTIPPQ